jgi:sterol desaturase/sphingolipid hydroxylase (fatty acid hydroxylase superfamily)
VSSLPTEVIEVVGQTMVKVIPVTLALALVFTVLSHFWACNPGKPRWRKRELVTDICYWFFVPVFARIFRIGLLVLGAAVLFNIHEPDELIALYDNGHGPLSQLPLWVQAILFLVASDFMLYRLHRWGRSNTLLATPVFHRRHHTSLEEGGNTSFAGTFRSGMSCWARSACRRAGCLRFTVWTIRRSPPRSAGNWPMHSVNSQVSSFHEH